MRMIKTYEGMTMNCDVIATIQSVFMNITTGSISEMVDDGFDPDTLEFAVTAFTTLGDEIVLAVYATEEERDYLQDLFNFYILDYVLQFVENILELIRFILQILLVIAKNQDNK